MEATTASRSAERATAPFLVAHRAGNDLTRMRRAESARVELIEADVHLFAGRLEVRHLKTAGPIPILWDRWELAPPWSPRLLLHDLLDARAPGTELMLDLKRGGPALARAVLRALDDRPPSARITVCSRDWRLLGPFDGRADVRVVHSVGSVRQLRAFRRLAARAPLAGVSIHRRLLDGPIVHDLRTRAKLLLAWPVETAADARELAGWGVDGLISQRFEQVATALRAA
jgi:glycerophosphoryl diester phosphodiesterase